MALSKTTQDHEEIKAWAEERGAKPAEVASTEGKGGPGIIRLEFPGAPHANDSNLKEISWEDFFEKFDQSGLAMVFQEVTADGERSNFNKLIHPENASASAVPSGGSKTAAKKSASKKSAPAKKTSGSAKKATAAKKAPAKAAAKKSAPAPAKKASAKKAPAKKTPAKKTAAKSAGRSKSSAAKGAAKKTAPKKTSAKKSPAKKTSRR